MLKIYAIIMGSNSELTQSEISYFLYKISRLYINCWILRDSVIFLSTDQSAEQIHNRISSKIEFPINFIVTELAKNWWGNFSKDFFNWLDKENPNWNL